MISHKVYRSEGEDRRWLVLMFETQFLRTEFKKTVS